MRHFARLVVAKLTVAIGTGLPLLAATAAQAAPCVTSAEFAALAQFALPSVVEGARQRCQNTLPSGAFLRTGAAAMEQRFRQGSVQAWPQARAAFLKIGNTGKDADTLLAALPDDGLRSMLDTVVQGLVVSQLPLGDCDKVDRLLGDIAPLPSRNTADLIALLVEFGADKKSGKPVPVTICPS